MNVNVETVLQQLELTHGPYIHSVGLPALFAATYARTFLTVKRVNILTIGMDTDSRESEENF